MPFYSFFGLFLETLRIGRFWAIFGPFWALFGDPQNWPFLGLFWPFFRPLIIKSI